MEGVTLFEYVRVRCLTGRVASVAKAAAHWLLLVQELTDARIAHGDLQHANVLVTWAGRLKLVDYDGVCVPSLAGQRNLETGVPPYQHPQRNPETRLSLALDSFSALLIYVALRALAAEPGLWARHVEQPGYDKLLFQTEDFRDSAASELYCDLKQSPEREARRLAEILWAAAAADMSEVPRLAEVVDSRVHIGVPTGGQQAGHARDRQAAGEADFSLDAAKVILEVVAGPIEGQRFVFDQHDTFVFGRSHECHAQILDDQWVSRHHFLLEAVPPQARIRDLGSRNGTFVNGVKHGGRQRGEDAKQAAGRHYPEVDLQDGDEVTVGRTTIRVTIEQPAAAAAVIPEPPENALPSGPLIPGYRIGDQIGSGGISAVYRSLREADGQRVAVKVVRPRIAVSDDEYHAVLIATERARQLHHPHIATVLESGLVACTLYFVMEYCDGGNLQQWVAARDGRVSVTDVGPLMVQCLDALEYAHAHDVVHRGLKPQNVLFSSQDGHAIVKIADFALTDKLEMVGLAGMMATGPVHVDYDFLPREQLTGFRCSSAASDLWSLAATFYHALTGQCPYDFSGRDPIEVILHDDPRPLRDRNPAVPQPVANVIDQALSSDPAARCQTAAGMKAALQEAFAAADVRIDSAETGSAQYRG